jgi:NADH-quinone oxidoreductase subunit D
MSTATATTPKTRPMEPRRTTSTVARRSVGVSTPAAAEGRWNLNFGPQHPATHTTLHLELELEGETVVGCTPHIGYLHSGFEKLAEHLNYNQYVVVTDRMNYISPMANNIAWHTACEKLFGITVPERCQYIRTIIAEMARIQDHLLCCGAAALDLGAFSVFLYTFQQREYIYDIFEAACGHRFTTSYTRLGGLSADVPEGWLDRCEKFTDGLLAVVDETEKLLVRNRIFVDRCKGVGAISKEDAINWGLTGPVGRASGIERDVRKNEPYLVYDRVNFKVPVATGGDVYARFLVRMAEMRESASIIRQLTKTTPKGPVNVDPGLKVTLPDKGAVYGSIEGLIQHFEITMTNRGFLPPVAECYGANEAANGELGFYLVSDGGPCAYRAKCRPPSFVNFSVFPKLVYGHQISDVAAILGSLNIIAAELDR